MIAGVARPLFRAPLPHDDLGVFGGVFVLIFTVDLVETLRRAGDTPGPAALLVAWLSLLHTPIVAEQALPFAVLFGAMIAFLNLSRGWNWWWRAPPACRSGSSSPRAVFVALAIGVVQ